MNRLIFIGALLLSACASIQSPTGGDKDEESPVMAIDSAIFKANSRPSVINLAFNENVDINTALISINPQISPKPNFKVKNRSLRIYLPKDSLTENTTYSINLNDAVKDINEGNVGNYPILLFSTGNKIDSSAKSILISNYTEKQKVLIQIKSDGNTYMYTTNKENFEVAGIPNDKNAVCTAFIDKNNNQTFDKNEKGNIISPLNDSNSIFLISPNKNILKLLKNGPFTYLIGTHKNQLNTNSALHKDTLILENIADTIKYTNNFNSISAQIDSISFYSSIIQEERKPSDTNRIYLTTNFPITSINPDSILIISYNDTIRNYKTEITKSNTIKITFDSTINTTTLNLKKGALKYSPSYYNTPTTLAIDYPNLFELQVVNNKPFATTVYLYTSKGEIKDFFVLQPNDIKPLHLPKESYELVYFNDLNKDGYINHPLEKTGKEEVYIKKNITLLKGFSNVIKL